MGSVQQVRIQCTAQDLIHFLPPPLPVEIGAFITDGIMSKVYWSFGWIMIFLTLWNLAAQAVYMTLSLVTACFLWRDARAVAAGQPVGAGGGDSTGLLGASGVTSSTTEPWHSSDPQRRAALAGRCSECACLSAEGNWAGDYAWLRWAEGRLTPRTQALLQHRDRFFYVVIATGSLVGIGFWGALFPAPQVQAKFFHEGQIGESARTVVDHGFTTLAIVCDALLVRHRGDTKAIWGAVILVVFASAYSGWNRLVFHLTNHWAYPSIQLRIASLSIPAQVAVYLVTIALFPCMFLLWRLALNRYWRCCEARRARSESEAGLRMMAVAPLLGSSSNSSASGPAHTGGSSVNQSEKRPVYVF